MTAAQKKLKVTLVRSVAGRLPSHRACVAGLGLRRQRHTVEIADTPEIRGLIAKVGFLVKVEEI
jgi:large subunit ribosomal protein L30